MTGSDLRRTPRSGLGRLALWAWGLSIAALAVSGFGQMPIFKRYYIADVPGLGWTADFWFTHRLHYVAGAVLIFLAVCALTRFVAARASRRLTPLGRARAWVLAGIVLTGAVRVIKNLPAHHFGRELTMAVDWTHLGLAVIFLLLMLAAAVARQPWTAPRPPRG